MTHVDRAVRRAGVRLMLMDFLRAITWCVTACLGVLLVLVLVERLGRVAIPWREVVMLSAVGGLLGAGVWTFVRRRSATQVAIELDARGDLRESLSTALLVRSREDAWSRAVVETAEARAAGVRVREVVPIRAPRSWGAPVVAGAALLLAWMLVPTLVAKERSSEREGLQEVHRVLLEQRENQKKLEELLKEAKIELGKDDLTFGAELPERASTPEDIQRAMVKQLTGLTELLDSTSASRAQQMEALKRELSRLEDPGQGPLGEVAKKLSEGDLSGAKRALDDLRRQIESGDLSEEQKAELRKQLESMSKQMEQLAKMQEQLARQMGEAMRQAGMSQQQIQQALKSPEAMRQALEQMTSITPQQKQQMMDMMQKMHAQQQMGAMSKAMGQMSRKMGQKPDGEMLGEMGELGELGEMLSEMEMAEQEMQAMQAAFEEAKYQLESLCNGLCQGQGQPWLIEKWRSGGSGGAGQGNGGPSPADSPFDFDLKSQKAKTQNAGGPIIASTLVDGPQISGESVAAFGAAVSAGAQAASDALDNMIVPREYHNAVKAYFGSLKEAGK